MHALPLLSSSQSISRLLYLRLFTCRADVVFRSVAYSFRRLYSCHHQQSRRPITTHPRILDVYLCVHFCILRWEKIEAVLLVRRKKWCMTFTQPPPPRHLPLLNDPTDDFRFSSRSRSFSRENTVGLAHPAGLTIRRRWKKSLFDGWPLAYREKESRGKIISPSTRFHLAIAMAYKCATRTQQALRRDCTDRYENVKRFLLTLE